MNRVGRSTRPSLRTLALGYVVLGAVLYAGLGWLMFQRTQTIQREISEENRRQAAAEIEYAVADLLIQAQAVAQNIANWDEVSQQLFDPAYYAYWTKNRLHASGHLPSYVTSTELYDSTGRPLPGEGSANMPETISAEDLAPFVQREQERVYLMTFASVTGWKPETPAAGFVAIRIDLLAALMAQGRYRYVDPETFFLASETGQRLTTDQILEYLRFEALPNPKGAELQALVVNHTSQVAALAVALSLLFYVILVIFVANPLRRMSLYIDHLRGTGTPSSARHPSDTMPIAELEKVRQSLADYQLRLEEVHGSLDQKNRELWEMAHHDPLTGSLNRRAFDEDWGHTLAITDGLRVEVSLVLIDCDHFKAINDTYGHDVGDRVLQMIARVVHASLRRGDRLYRLGGDEFAALFIDAGLTHAERAARRCLDALRQYDYRTLGLREPLRVSIGVAHAMGTEPGPLKELYRHADVAMYHAKRPGGHKMVVYRKEMDASAPILFSNRAVHAIYEAIDSGRNIEMHYQPIVGLPNEDLRFLEALVRVRDNGDLILPDHILPIVENRHLQVKFDTMVIESVRRDLDAALPPKQTGISINLSGASLIDPDVLQALTTFAPHMKDHPIILEVTETSVIAQLQLASKHLRQLRDAGFLVALDDFGSGYSSLRYLADMPVDIVKFDIGLTQALCGTGPHAEMFAQLVSLIRRPGFQLIAEGIETRQMLQTILDLDFSYAQGYFLGSPQRLAPLQALQAESSDRASTNTLNSSRP